MAKSKNRNQNNSQPELKLSTNNPVIRIVTMVIVFALVATLAVSMFGSGLTAAAQ